MPMTTALDATGARVQRKITLRLIPFLFLLYITAYLDRLNVSFAGLDMTRELKFSGEVFGFGAGILLRLLPARDSRRDAGRKLERA